MFVANPFITLMAEVEDGGEGAADESQESEETPPEGEGAEGELQEIDPNDAWDADRARTKIRKLNAEIRKTKEKLRAQEEAANNPNPETQAEVAKLQAENLRLRVGARLGLPDELIDRLRGDSEEAVLEDAEKLLALITPSRPSDGRPKPRVSGGTEPAVEREETDPRKLAELVPRM